jgi:hypothetical protein
MSTDSREKYTADPVQFGKVNALLKSFSQCFRLAYSLKSFRGTPTDSVLAPCTLNDRYGIQVFVVDRY